MAVREQALQDLVHAPQVGAQDSRAVLEVHPQVNVLEVAEAAVLVEARTIIQEEAVVQAEDGQVLTMELVQAVMALALVVIIQVAVALLQTEQMGQQEQVGPREQ